jgi:DnaJ-class molecular chaperone
MTHYATLGVAETATADEIKRAYRKLASQHHPDKGGDVKKFQSIEEAYRILSDDGKRQQYNAERHGSGTGVHFQWHSNDVPPDLDSIFSQFGFGNPFQQNRQQRRNRDLQIEISVPLVTTLADQVKTISVQTTNGTRETVEVRIPKGITDGSNIRYSGLGDNLFNTISRGDLYVQINVHNAENFVVTGIDLHTKISVNCVTAMTGGTALVTGLDNTQFVITIPQGTQPNTKFRIPNQGLYQTNSDNRGHLYVEMAVSIPQDLSQEQIQILKSFTDTQ